MGASEIPFLDVGAGYRELKAELDDAVGRVLMSGWYIGGEELSAFERDFSHYVEARYCVGVGNGLDALHLALRAMGVGPGDEVIVPSNTYIATWLAVSYVGATPVPVEPDERTYNLNPLLIEDAVTEKTKAVIPVHLYGQPADLDPILSVARMHGIWVLEDAAQSHGARYKGRKLGAHGDAVAWSFYPGKNLGALGDGGAVTTDNEELAERIRVLSNYGSKEKYINDVQGFNSRLDPLQAAALKVKLAHLDNWNSRREKIAAIYFKGLAGLPLVLPHVAEWGVPVWHLFVIRHPQRDELQRYLKAQGIGTVIHYPIPPHLQAAYSELGLRDGDLPASERIHSEVLSLPLGPHMTVPQAEQVVEVIRAFHSTT